MKYLITKNSYGDLVGFLPFNDGDCLPEPREYFTDFVADVLTAVTLNADAAEVYWLYEVSFGEGDTLFVTAFDYSDAVVTAMLHRGVTHPPLFVREYDVYAIGKGDPTPAATYSFADASEPILQMLARLTDDNRDFVAHAVTYADGLDADTLRSFEEEYIRNSLGVMGKTATCLSADEIRRVCHYIWNNHMLLESTCPSLTLYRLLDRHGKESDPILALIWTYVFEQWAHYDCHMPYTLYRLIVDGVLDGYLDGFLAEREILT